MALHCFALPCLACFLLACVSRPISLICVLQLAPLFAVALCLLECSDESSAVSGWHDGCVGLGDEGLYIMIRRDDVFDTVLSRWKWRKKGGGAATWLLIAVYTADT